MVYIGLEKPKAEGVFKTRERPATGNNRIESYEIDSLRSQIRNMCKHDKSVEMMTKYETQRSILEVDNQGYTGIRVSSRMRRMD